LLSSNKKGKTKLKVNFANCSVFLSSFLIANLWFHLLHHYHALEFHCLTLAVLFFSVLKRKIEIEFGEIFKLFFIIDLVLSETNAICWIINLTVF
jgi:hypothetical protein